MKLVARQELRYASKNYNAGDEFDCDDTHAVLLKAIGKAADAPKAKKADATPEVFTDLSKRPPPMPTADPVTQLAEEAAAPRRRYNRRDMQAEE